MRRTTLLLALIWLLLAPRALAADEPSFGPAPQWVEPVAIPDPDPERAAQPIQPLLLNSQVRYGEADEYYGEYATLIQSPAGLSMLGTITIPWQPDQTDLIIHRLHILRDGEIIDPLANGPTRTPTSGKPLAFCRTRGRAALLNASRGSSGRPRRCRSPRG